MNGLAITIIVGQLPKLFGFSTDADGFVDEIRAVRRRTSTRPTRRRSSSGVGVLVRPARAAPAHDEDPGGARGRRRRHRRLGGVRARRPRGSRPSARCPRASRADRPVDERRDVGPLLIAAVGITLVSLTDTIATATSFAARRGDEVDPDQEMIGMGAANIAAGFFQGFAISTSGSRTAVAEQSGAKSQVTGLVGAGVVALLLLFFNSLLADLPQTALAAVVIAAALSLAGHRRSLRRYWPVRRAPSPCRWSRPWASCCSGSCRASSSRSSCRSCCSSGAAGGPTARCSARSTGSRAGTASSGIPSRGGARRGRLPVGGAAVLRQLRHLPRAGPPTSSGSGTPPGWCSSARPSPTSTSPRPTCSSGSTSSSTPRACTWRSSRCASRLQDLVLAVRAA